MTLIYYFLLSTEHTSATKITAITIDTSTPSAEDSNKLDKIQVIESILRRILQKVPQKAINDFDLLFSFIYRAYISYQDHSHNH